MSTLDLLEERNEIIEEFIPLVKYIASCISLGKNKSMEYEDLVGYGVIGLIDAISKYDKTKGVKFSSYASIRIRGAIIDEIRRNRLISKGAKEKFNRFNEVVEELQKKFFRQPSIYEIAEHMGLSIDDVLKIENYINYISIVSLEEVIYSEGEDITIMAIIEDKNSPTPEESYEEKEKVEILSQAIESLNEKDRRVLNLYYYEKLTLKEIGQELGVSESRVCQLHSKAILSLRDKMEKINYV